MRSAHCKPFTTVTYIRTARKGTNLINFIQNLNLPFYEQISCVRPNTQLSYRTLDKSPKIQIFYTESYPGGRLWGLSPPP